MVSNVPGVPPGEKVIIALGVLEEVVERSQAVLEQFVGAKITLHTEEEIQSVVQRIVDSHPTLVRDYGPQQVAVEVCPYKNRVEVHYSDQMYWSYRWHTKNTLSH